MKIAVVILNWNGKQLLEQFLPSVIQFSEEATVYVADNASTDDSVAFVRANFPTVSIVVNATNTGYAGGYNEALQHIEADVYALVNSDIEVTENWLQPILQLFENEPNTSIIQPKILDYKNKKLFEYAGAGGGIGSWSYDKGPVNDNGTFLFVAGDIGIEYHYDIPLMLSLDFRPEIYFGDGYRNDNFGPDIALGIRYKF